MSGHSKWNNIKRKKEKTDGARAKVFTKIGREISVAVRDGGPNPASNSKLADLIAKAKRMSVPNDNIQRIIKKAEGGDKTEFEAITYEGGGPGGVAFGLKMLFGDAAHCFFAEPTHSPCMMLGMATGENNSICVQDFGIDNRTAADGLAVGRASGFVGGLMRPFMSGCYTLQDERMYTLLAQLADAEDLYLEPSALAGMYGPVLTQPGQLLGAYTEAALPAGALANATHLVWATGGNMVPREEMQRYYAKGRALAQG